VKSAAGTFESLITNLLLVLLVVLNLILTLILTSGTPKLAAN